MKHLLLVDSPSRTKAPTHAWLIGYISEAVIAQEKFVIAVFKRLFKPTTRRLHVANRVIKVVEVIAQENGEHAWVIRSDFLNQLQFVMNVWDDEVRLIHALGLTLMSCIS